MASLLTSCDTPPDPPDRTVAAASAQVCEEFGRVEECTDGPTLGLCRRGTRSCMQTHWTACEGEVPPTDEVCDGEDNDCDGEVDELVTNRCGTCGEEPVEVCDGVDNDCDLLVDEGFDDVLEVCNGIDDNCDGNVDEGLTKAELCAPSSAPSWLVYDDEQPASVCRMGRRVCQDGAWSECVDWSGPEVETCDGLDNDCDGVVDEVDVASQCGVEYVGICRPGTMMCVEDEMLCVGAVLPEAEVCDNLDNNCDGQTDEGLVRPCETVCGEGFERCVVGDWSDCTAPVPTDEICDGVDNDCDGVIDEGIACLCEEGAMEACAAPSCGWGIRRCVESAWGECEGSVPQPEQCNGHDDDCDGLIDEELVRDCYTGDPTTLGVGVCTGGQEICEAGTWSACSGEVTPAHEACDGVDNDCDGEIDNMRRIIEKADIVFAIDVSGSMEPYTIALGEALSDYVRSIDGTEHQFGLAIFGGEGGGDGVLFTQLTDLQSVLPHLPPDVIAGAIEPSWDTTFDLASSGNPLGVAWREDATPVVIMLTDELPQSNRGLTHTEVGEAIATCQLPGCNAATNENWIAGDPTDVFVITRPNVFSLWEQALPDDRQRLFDMDRIVHDETVDVDLRLIFRDICIERR